MKIFLTYFIIRTYYFFFYFIQLVLKNTHTLSSILHSILFKYLYSFFLFSFFNFTFVISTISLTFTYSLLSALRFFLSQQLALSSQPSVLFLLLNISLILTLSVENGEISLYRTCRRVKGPKNIFLPLSLSLSLSHTHTACHCQISLIRSVFDVQPPLGLGLEDLWDIVMLTNFGSGLWAFR